MYTNKVFRTVKCVLFIEVPSFQGVDRFHCRFAVNQQVTYITYFKTL